MLDESVDVSWFIKNVYRIDKMVKEKDPLLGEDPLQFWVSLIKDFVKKGVPHSCLEDLRSSDFGVEVFREAVKDPEFIKGLLKFDGHKGFTMSKESKNKVEFYNFFDNFTSKNYEMSEQSGSRVPTIDGDKRFFKKDANYYKTFQLFVDNCTKKDFETACNKGKFLSQREIFLVRKFVNMSLEVKAYEKKYSPEFISNEKVAIPFKIISDVKKSFVKRVDFWFNLNGIKHNYFNNYSDLILIDNTSSSMPIIESLVGKKDMKNFYTYVARNSREYLGINPSIVAKFENTPHLEKIEREYVNELFKEIKVKGLKSTSNAYVSELNRFVNYNVESKSYTEDQSAAVLEALMIEKVIHKSDKINWSIAKKIKFEDPEQNKKVVFSLMLAAYNYELGYDLSTEGKDLFPVNVDDVGFKKLTAQWSEKSLMEILELHRELEKITGVTLPKTKLISFKAVSEVVQKTNNLEDLDINRFKI